MLLQYTQEVSISRHTHMAYSNNMHQVEYRGWVDIRILNLNIRLWYVQYAKVLRGWIL